MSDIPVPRSFEQIVGDMITAFLARTGVPNLRIGSPILSLIESAAQSDFRGSQDLFTTLNSLVLDRATGIALDRIGADEQVPRIAQSASTGTLTIADSSFTKLESRIYQGGAAPIVGSQTILVENALNWNVAGSTSTGSGSIYIGRGTNNYEGPIAYTNKSLHISGAYWVITLATPTTRFHNVGEGVVVAQGGNRSVPAGSTVRTPQGNASTAVEFSTLYSAVIPDGETQVLGVAATAKTPGIIGNISAGAVREFSSPPFAGATVTNPMPFTDGLNAESDESYRERIRDARNTRTRGTAEAIRSFVVGITALDENKRVLSGSVVVTQGEPTNLYIDDGTGYEEKTLGIPYEVVEDSAIGGEKHFQLENGRPVAKAQVESSLSAPFLLPAGAQLAVEIGGVKSLHVFSAGDFLSPGIVSAYEVTSSINANPNITFGARTSSSGQKVVLFAREDTNEDVEVVAASTGYTDANNFMGFPFGLHKTLWLYKDDRLLNKDGKLAVVETKVQSLWGSITAGATLNVKVDGIPFNATIANQDFVDAGTQYATVSSTNSLDAWATVLNYKLPGITTTVNGAALDLTSNLGRNARASVEILSTGTMHSIFSTTSAVGESSDYTLDRNLGQITLKTVLQANERLTAGSLATRSFIETAPFTAKTVLADGTSNTLVSESGAELWFVVDGGAVSPSTGIGPGTSIGVSTVSAPPWGERVIYSGVSGSSIFNLANVGDWLIVTDIAFNIANRGAFRIVPVDPDATKQYVVVERPSGVAFTQSVPLTHGNLRLVKTTAIPQRVYIPAAANYTALSLSSAIQSYLTGATAQAYRTTTLRVRTNTFNIDGDIALVAWNFEGSKLGLPRTDAEGSGTSHLASIRANKKYAGTPSFSVGQLASAASPSVLTLSSIGDFKTNSVLAGLKTLPESGLINSQDLFGNYNHVTTISDITGATVTTRKNVLQDWLEGQRVYAAAPYSVTARDQFAVVSNGDEVTGRYAMNAYRKVKPVTGSYSMVNDFVDADNGNSTLARGFGLDFNWEDFAVHMKARVKAAGILWRYYRHGPEGNAARVRYTYPLAANQPVTVTSDMLTSTDKLDISVQIPSTTARTGYTVRNSTKIGVASGPINLTTGLYTNVYVFNLAISTASRTSNVTTLTLNLPASVTDHGFNTNDIVWVNSGSGSFTTGVKIITARTVNTISYAEISGDVASGAITGTVSFDNAGEVSLSGGSIVVGDLMNINTNSSVTPAYESTVKLFSFANDYVTANSPTGVFVFGSKPLVWGSINNTSNLSFFPVNSGANTCAAIVGVVNGTANTPITGFDYSGGGSISDASYEAIVSGYHFYDLVDGVNFVNIAPAVLSDSVNTTFTFKNGVSAGLTSPAIDWANEDVRLVPITALNWTNWLEAPGVGGLFSSAEIQLANRALVPQITGSTTGSSGSIQVSGGTANSLAATVEGSAILVGTNMVISVDKALGDGLGGDTWVRLQNEVTGPKTIITATTKLASITTGGLFTFDSGFDKAWKYSGDAANLYYTNRGFQIEKQGDYVMYSLVDGGAISLATVQEGDWVVMSATTGTLDDIPFASSLNTGTFRIVRADATNNAFWVENSGAVEEISRCNIAFIDFNSIMPGDKLSIGSTIWGSGNVGTWTVAAVVNIFSNPADRWKFNVDISAKATAAHGASGSLGTNAGLIQVYEANPTKLTKKIVAIGPNASNSSLVDIKLKTSPGYSLIGTNYGTVITAMDKLQFGVDTATGVSEDLVVGIDGYLQNTGLIAEANKVVYGDESNPSSYPGVAAAGASVNINGPLVRRVQVSLSIRVKTGINSLDIRDKVKSGVATVINQTPVGQPISFSSLIKAAESVNGVAAVAIISPAYSSTSDRIPVQPQEKPLVVNLDQDILVSLVGE